MAYTAAALTAAAAAAAIAAAASAWVNKNAGLGKGNSILVLLCGETQTKQSGTWDQQTIKALAQKPQRHLHLT